MDRPVEPKLRSKAFSAAINSKFFLWGGDGASDVSHVHVFDSSCGAWTAKQTTGTPPPGYKGGASTSVGDIMYTYGGWDHHDKDTGCLCELNIKTLIWQLLSREGPMKKCGCAMAARKNMLMLFGGNTSSPRSVQPGSQCVKDRYGDFYLNEVHVYNLKTSECISSEYIRSRSRNRLGELQATPYLTTSHSIIVKFRRILTHHSYLDTELS